MTGKRRNGFAHLKVIAVSATAWSFAACETPAAVDTPPTATFERGPRPEPRDAAQLYQAKCMPCHDARGWGTRALARRLPAGQAGLSERDALPAAFVEQVIRTGIGSMPGFTPSDITSEEAGAIARWLAAPD